MRHIGTICLILLLSGFAHAAELPNTTSFRHLLRAKSISCEDCHGVAKPKTIVHGNRETVLNVHNSHYGDIECLSCHKIHSKGTLMCNECHTWDIEVK